MDSEKEGIARDGAQDLIQATQVIQCMVTSSGEERSFDDRRKLLRGLNQESNPFGLRSRSLW